MAERVGFIGLGIMGRGMANNLLKAGFQVRVWNRTASRMDASVWRQVGLADGELLLQRDLANEEEKKGLARAVLADDEADRGTAVSDTVDVPDQGFDLPLAADLDMLQADPRNDARSQRRNDRIAISRLEAWGWLGIHSSSPMRCAG